MENRFFSNAELVELNRVRALGVGALKYSFDWFRGTNRPLFLFGAGKIAERAVYGDLAKANIVGLIDNNPSLQGTERYGLRVHSPEEALAKNGSAIVVVAMHQFRGVPEVVRQCRELGFETVAYHHCEFYSDPSKFTERMETEPQAAKAMDIWADDRSREVYRTMVRYRAAFDPESLPVSRHERQYFEKLAPLSSFRNFADVGAFTGDTYLEYIGYTRNEFDNYYAFEPDHASFLELRGVVGDRPNVHLHNAAVSCRSGVASWTSNVMASRISDTGERSVRCLTLDETLSEKPVSFIKMDIEGAEPDALAGARELIGRRKPVLAICVYHELDHLWSLPLWIRNLNLGYRLFLRHYCVYWHYDTICYAIP